MAVKGHSTKAFYGNQANFTDSTTWTAFAKVTGVTPPKPQADDIDTSHMESADQFKEFEPGWADGGEVELQLQFAAADNASVYGLFRQPKGFRLEFSNGSRWSFNGYIKGFGNEVEREGIVSTTVTFKVSGKPEFTAVPA